MFQCRDIEIQESPNTVCQAGLLALVERAALDGRRSETPLPAEVGQVVAF